MEQVLEAAFGASRRALVAEPPKIVKGTDPLDPEPDIAQRSRTNFRDRPAAGRGSGS